MPGVGAGCGVWRRRRGFPQTIVVNGVTYSLLRDEATGAILLDPATSQPLYG